MPEKVCYKSIKIIAVIHLNHRNVSIQPSQCFVRRALVEMYAVIRRF